MTYMYDILLNFTDSKRIYDFFEWDCNDEILNIKKISIFKVSKKTLLDIYNYKVKIDDNFLKKIENTAIIYKQSKRKYKYLTILSDGNKAIGICMNDIRGCWMDGRLEEKEGCFVLRTTSVSPLDRDKDTLSLTREKCIRIFPLSMKG